VSHFNKSAGFFNSRMTGGSLAAVINRRLTEPGCLIASDGSRRPSQPGQETLPVFVREIL
jgi:hypothetical protein